MDSKLGGRHVQVLEEVDGGKMNMIKGHCIIYDNIIYDILIYNI